MPAAPAGENLLTPGQQAQFDKIISEVLERNRRIFSDRRINAYPGRVLRRLIGNIPGSFGLHPQIRFYDTSSPGAFVSPGGEIYISRQMAAYLHSESDLAALLANELAYVLTHQQAVEFSQAAGQLLGVTDFASHDGVLDVYGRLAALPASDPDAAQRWKQQDAGRREARQEAADRTALYLLAAAGYPPQTMKQLFERIAQGHEETGNWLTGLFQPKAPGQKRLVALLESLDAMPAACRGQGTLAPVGDFSAWRDALIAFDPPPGPARLPGLRIVGKLGSGLPGTVKRIRFSPDGRYLLVHNTSGVLVFTTNPLAYQFRIDAPDATRAVFSSDSRSVELYTAGLRVEHWSIFPPKRLSVRMAPPPRQCWKEAPSPRGQFLVGMGCDGGLFIKDESTGRTIFSQSEKGTWLKWAFSPDDRYFFATEWQDTAPEPTAVDLKEGRQLFLPESANSLFARDDSFVFLDSTRLAVATEEGSRILVIRFPSGKLLGGIDLSRPKNHREGNADLETSVAPERAMPKRIATVTQGDDELLLFPFGGYPAALLDVKKRKLVAEFTSPAIDVFHGIAAVQLGNWLKLDDLRTGHILDSVPLPDGLLDPLKTAVVSPDLQWLAISGSREGGVFHLGRDGSLFDQTPQFTDAWFGVAKDLYLTFPGADVQSPEQPPAKATIRRFDLETRAPSPRLHPSPDEREYGPWLVAFRTGQGQAVPADKVTLEVRALGESKPLWTRELPYSPSTVRLDPTGKLLLFGWLLSPSLQMGHAGLRLTANVARYLGAGAKDAGYAFQIFEAKTGKMLGRFFRRGSQEGEAWQDATAPGNALVITDKNGLTQVYSWKTERREGLALGHALAVSPDGKFACLGVSPRDLAVARLPSLESTATLKFPRAILLTRFSADGRRLFVLTRDQRYYVFDMAPLAARTEKSAVH